MKRILAPFAGLSNIELPIPRQHFYAIIMLAVFSIASVTLLPPPNELFTDKPIPVPQDNLSEDAELSKQAADTEFINVPEQLLQGDDVIDGLNTDTGDSADNEPEPVAYTVKDDDNLSYIFNTLNLSPATLQKLLKVDSKNLLMHLRPGQKLTFYLDNKDNVLRLDVPYEDNKQMVFEQSKDTFASRVVAISDDDSDVDTEDVATTADKPATADKTVAADTSAKTITTAAADATAHKQVHVAIKPTRVLHGKISGTFATSARASGLSIGHIHQIARLFQGRIDFRRDLRSGDTFRVLFDKNAIGGKATSDARVLAVEFNTKGKKYSAFRGGKDNQFYDAKGNSMSVTSSGKFMRFPFGFTPKISSQFNPHRLNPVTGRVAPHNGVDFSVPIGTPVEATADGVVVKVGRHPTMGVFIVLRNSGRYSTVFMHLSKGMVRPGQKIKMGQMIALSGNTGRSTGPHVHYEFHINDRPVNPLRVDLPMNQPMDNKAQNTMLAKIREYKRLLGDSES
jgi:murein DD-endopeptidase